MCYFNNAGPAGWCGTCYHGDLNPGEEGYCDYYNGKIMYLVNTFIIYILMQLECPVAVDNATNYFDAIK